MAKFYQSVMLAGVALLAAPAMQLQAQPDPVTLYGVKIYCEEGAYSGVYSIEASEGAQPQLYWSDGDMLGTGGAVYADGSLYILSYLDFFGMQIWSYLTCDVENKTYDYTMPEDLELTDIGTPSTYDPSTGNVYAISLDPTTLDGSTVLSIMDLTTARKTPVAPIERMAAMAADRAGTLYGIDMAGTLCIIDKHTGATTAVGSTGVVPNANNTAVIDYNTGVMYWNAYTADGGFLYTVDVATAAATLLSTFEPSYQFDGLFIIQSAASEGAPAQASDVEARFEGASLEGVVSFTLPTTDAEGNTLSSDLNYKVTLDGKTLGEATAAPGTRVDFPVAVDARGTKQFLVEVSNDAGAAIPASVMLFVGMDDPLAPENVEVTVEGLTATLTWTVPEKGVNGGFIDPQALRTIVHRGPYDELLASWWEGTEFVDQLDFDGIQPLMYGIRCYIDPEVVSDMSFSNIVTVGEYVEPPYVEDLTDIFRQLVFNTVDANGDQCSWMYEEELGSMVCNWPIADTSDDWFITAPIRLEEGKSYRVVATVRSEGKWNYTEQKYEDVYAGTLDICLGTGNTPDHMTTSLLEPTEVESIELHELATPVFTVPSTGIYHVGLHHSGVRSIYYTLLNRLEIHPDNSGVESAVAGNAGLSVSTAAGELRISNPEGEVVTVATPDGRVVATTSLTGDVIPAVPGLYIVATPSAVVKVVLN